MRFARRTDMNQKAIVAALRQHGATVKVIHQPFDLQIWNGDKTMYLEVKNLKTSYGKRGLNAKQEQEAHGLPMALVTDVESALKAFAELCK